MAGTENDIFTLSDGTDARTLNLTSFDALDDAVPFVPSADPVAEFTAALREFGLKPGREGIIADDTWRRLDIDGDKRGQNDGGYVFAIQPDGFACGYFTNYKTGEGQGWHSKSGTAHVLSDAEKASIKRQREEGERRREEEKRNRLEYSMRKWDEAGAYSDKHPYLVKKRIDALPGCRQDGDMLMVPALIYGKIACYQRIFPDGGKKYCAGWIKGATYRLKGSTDTIAICEGVATGWAVNKSTGWATVVAFDAGSLKMAAEEIRESYKDATIVIAGDNDKPDPNTGVRPGQAKAKEAADANSVKGFAVWPKDEGTDWWDVWANDGPEAVIKSLGIIHRSAFKFTRVGELELTEPEFLIDGLLETEAMAMLFGDPGCGKSFVAVDLACCVAAGVPYNGNEVKAGPVFYIAGEGHSGLVRRFKAWAKHRGVSLADLPLFKSERAADFLNAESAKAVANAVTDLAMIEGQPALIIVDTVARSFGGGDENSTQDMNAFVTAMDDLKARYPGCTLLLVHHTGHGDKSRARGAMSLKGALDAEYRVSRDGTNIKIACTKMKDAEEPEPINLTFKEVVLGKDRRGEDFGSAVLVAGGEGAGSGGLKLDGDAGIAMKALKTELAGMDEDEVRSDLFGGVHNSDWQEAFLRIHHGDNEDSKKRAFRRGKGKLVEMGIVYCIDDFYKLSS